LSGAFDGGAQIPVTLQPPSHNDPSATFNSPNRSPRSSRSRTRLAVIGSNREVREEPRAPVANPGPPFIGIASSLIDRTATVRLPSYLGSDSRRRSETTAPQSGRRGGATSAESARRGQEPSRCRRSSPRRLYIRCLFGKKRLRFRLRLHSPTFAVIGPTIARAVPRRGDEVIA
jgi:hypothetical protein